jgi:hypothetical protein
LFSICGKFKLWVLISKKKQVGNGSTARNGGEERTGERAKPGREGEILVCEKTRRQVDYVCELLMMAASASHFTVLLWTLRSYLFFGGSNESVNGFQWAYLVKYPTS